MCRNGYRNPRYEHINPYGKYAFDVSKDLGGPKLRPHRPGRPPA